LTLNSGLNLIATVINYINRVKQSFTDNEVIFLINTNGKTTDGQMKALWKTGG
jgi:hypothetical protein